VQQQRAQLLHAPGQQPILSEGSHALDELHVLRAPPPRLVRLRVWSRDWGAPDVEGVEAFGDAEGGVWARAEV